MQALLVAGADVAGDLRRFHYFNLKRKKSNINNEEFDPGSG